VRAPSASTSDAHHLVQKGRGLVDRKAQVVDAQLGQLAARAQAHDRQGRVGPRRDHQVELWRLVIEEVRHPVVNRLRRDGGRRDGGRRDGVARDEVIVIQDEDDPARQGGDLVEQGNQDRLRGRGLERCAVEQPLRALGQAGVEPLEGSEQVGPELDWVVVLGVQREPGDRRIDLMDPFAQQGRLAKPRRGRDQGKLSREPRVQPLDQARARDPLWAKRGDAELGFQQGQI
jgi:hypothetical protein